MTSSETESVEASPAESTGPAKSTEPTLKPKPRIRRRLLLAGAVVFLVVIAAVVGSLPYVVASGPGTSAVLAVANGVLPGQVVLNDLKLGWRGGLQVSGFRLLDPNGETVVEVDLVHAPSIGVLDALTGLQDLGAVECAGLRLNLVRYEDGTTNLTRSLPAAGETDPDAAASPWDSAQIRLALDLADGQITDATDPNDPVSIHYAVQAENRPNEEATLTLSATLSRSGLDAGTISVTGNAIPPQGGFTDDRPLPNRAKVTATLKDVHLPSLQRLAHGQDWAAALLGPVMNGQLTSDWDLQTGGTFDAKFSSRYLDVHYFGKVDAQGVPLEAQGTTTLSLTPTNWSATRAALAPEAPQLLEPAKLTLSMSLPPEAIQPGQDLMPGKFDLQLAAEPIALLNALGQEAKLTDTRFRLSRADPSTPVAIAGGLTLQLPNTAPAVFALEGLAVPPSLTPTNPTPAKLELTSALTDLPLAGLAQFFTGEAPPALVALGPLSGQKTSTLTQLSPVGFRSEFQAEYTTPTARFAAQGQAHSDHHNDGAMLGWVLSPETVATATLEPALIGEATFPGITPAKRPVQLIEPVTVRVTHDKLRLNAAGMPQAGQVTAALDDLEANATGRSIATHGLQATMAWPDAAIWRANVDGQVALDGVPGTIEARANGVQDQGAYVPRSVALAVRELPVPALDALAQTGGLLTALLGPALEVTAELQGYEPGTDQPFDVAVRTDNLQADLQGEITAGMAVTLLPGAEVRLVVQPADPSLDPAQDPLPARPTTPTALTLAIRHAQFTPPTGSPLPAAEPADPNAPAAIVLPLDPLASGLDLDLALDDAVWQWPAIAPDADRPGPSVRLENTRLVLSAPDLTRPVSLSGSLRLEPAIPESDDNSDVGPIRANLDLTVDRLVDAAGRLVPQRITSQGRLKVDADNRLIAQVLGQGDWLTFAFGEKTSLTGDINLPAQGVGTFGLALESESGIETRLMAERSVPTEPIRYTLKGSAPRSLKRLEANGSLSLGGMLLKIDEAELDLALDFRRVGHLPPGLAQTVLDYQISATPTVGLRQTEVDLLSPFLSSGRLTFSMPALSFVYNNVIVPAGQTDLDLAYQAGQVTLHKLQSQILRGGIFATGQVRMQVPPTPEAGFGTLPTSITARGRGLELRPIAQMLFSPEALGSRAGGLASFDLQARGLANALMGSLLGELNVRVNRGNLAPLPVMSDIIEFLVGRMPSAMQSPVRNAMRELGLLINRRNVAAPKFGEDTADIEVVFQRNRAQFNRADVTTRIVSVDGTGNLFLTGHTNLAFELSKGNGPRAITIPVGLVLSNFDRVRVTGPVTSPEVKQGP